MYSQVESILERYPNSLRPSSPPAALGNAGGKSGASLFRFESTAGPLVLRRWPSRGLSRVEIERIHDWLALATGLSFIPAPLRALDGSTLQVDDSGGVWELSPWLPGAPALEPSDRPAKIETAFQGLAAFHKRLASFTSRGKSQGVKRRIGEIQACSDQELSQLRSLVVASPPCDSTALALQWIEIAASARSIVLDAIRPVEGFETRLQACLRDARGEHFLFVGDALSAIVDFGAMGIDSVAGDLARLLADWFEPQDSASRGLALDVYGTVRRLEPDERALIDAFEIGADFLIGLHWIRWAFVDQLTFQTPNSVRDGIMLGVGRLKRRIEML